MTKIQTFFKALQKITLAIALFCVLIQCSDEALLPNISENRTKDPFHNYPDSTLMGSTIGVGCSYIVPANQSIIDGKSLGLKPGSTICLNSSFSYGTLLFKNIVGTEDKPIIITNYGGTANIKATNKWYAVKTVKSKHFRITGGTVAGTYGINIQGGVMGLTLEFLSTNFEVDHVEISKVNFAGIMAKTDPSCNDSTIRENFTMNNVSLHDNYVHETGGEGLYVGNSFYDGMVRDCGIRLPHEIKGLKIFNNIVNSAGWEAIQVGCAVEGAEIYNNSIKNYGVANKQFQNNGIQIGAGTGGLVYNNLIAKGTGNGMIIMGIGDNIIYNNIIIDAGSNGIFCDERFTPGEGFKFINNTILNPKIDGIRLYAEQVPMNTIVNNIISNPGSYFSYIAPRSPNDAFVYLESPAVKVNMSNNLFANNLNKINFVAPLENNYRLNSNSEAVDSGTDISQYKIDTDFYSEKRLKGFAYDIGASEF